MKNLFILLFINAFNNVSAQVPTFCDKSIFDKPLEENNFVGSVFNYKDDIYVERDNWIWIFNKVNNKYGVKQVGEPQKTNKLFEGLSSIKTMFAITNIEMCDSIDTNCIETKNMFSLTLIKDKDDKIRVYKRSRKEHKYFIFNETTTFGVPNHNPLADNLITATVFIESNKMLIFIYRNYSENKDYFYQRYMGKHQLMQEIFPQDAKRVYSVNITLNVSLITSAFEYELPYGQKGLHFFSYNSDDNGSMQLTLSYCNHMNDKISCNIKNDPIFTPWTFFGCESNRSIPDFINQKTEDVSIMASILFLIFITVLLFCIEGFDPGHDLQIYDLEYI